MIRKRHTHIEIILSDDPKQRQHDLNLIKEKVAKRTKGSSKQVKDPKPSQQQTVQNKETIKKVTTKKAIPITKGAK